MEQSALFFIFKGTAKRPIAKYLQKIMPEGINDCTQVKGWKDIRVIQGSTEKYRSLLNKHPKKSMKTKRTRLNRW